MRVGPSNIDLSSIKKVDNLKFLVLFLTLFPDSFNGYIS